MNAGIRPTEMIELAEIEALKALLDRRKRDDVRLLALLIVLSCGLRKGEVCRLRVGDYRLIEGQWCIVSETLKQRGDKVVRRVVPIADEEANAILAKYLRQEHGAEPEATARRRGRSPAPRQARRWP